MCTNDFHQSAPLLKVHLTYLLTRKSFFHHSTLSPQEYNICFSTVCRPRGITVDKEVKDEADLLARTNVSLGNLKEEAILPRVIRRLIEGRKFIKKEMKSERDPKKKELLEIKQKVSLFLRC